MRMFLSNFNKQSPEAKTQDQVRGNTLPIKLDEVICISAWIIHFYGTSWKIIKKRFTHMQIAVFLFPGLFTLFAHFPTLSSSHEYGGLGFGRSGFVFRN